ncbi:MAG: hypothetical protein JWS10_933 [Cypionkella sp.]|uniref:hypothetical protein n=1 Tax=Cypionkella sp. TaxID=2811411 RepID=UPI00262757FB|nr:hypothetical protein [Cypionkella sp.]MDB5658318.1 hypothetical protein [Cypionkella sp.]
MTKAKPATRTTKTPVSPEAVTGPVTDIISAPIEGAADTTLPATGVGAPAEAVDEDTSTADAGPTLIETDADFATAVTDPAANFEASLRMEQTLVVKGPLQGRWRARRHFTIEPTSIRLDELTEAEIEALCGDPMLTVGIVAAPY